MHRTVNFYRTKDNKCPVEDFLDSLDSKTAQKVVWVLDLLEEFDIVPEKFFKKMKSTKHLWECRIDYKSNAYRIFCFFHKKNVIVLTHGISKKTQKTPKKEIEKALKYMNDYKNRSKK